MGGKNPPRSGSKKYAWLVVNTLQYVREQRKMLSSTVCSMCSKENSDVTASDMHHKLKMSWYWSTSPA